MDSDLEVLVAEGHHRQGVVVVARVLGVDGEDQLVAQVLAPPAFCGPGLVMRGRLALHVVPGSAPAAGAAEITEASSHSGRSSAPSTSIRNAGASSGTSAMQKSPCSSAGR